MLYILAERISMPIDFIEVEIPDEGCTSEPKKMKNLNFFKNLIFLSPGASNFIFQSFFDYYLHL